MTPATTRFGLGALVLMLLTACTLGPSRALRPAADCPALEGVAPPDGGWPSPPRASNIAHLVIVLQENHSFDTYFGRYCQGDAEPACTTGRACCEAAPARVTGADGSCVPGVVTDHYNVELCPNHTSRTEFHRLHWTGATFAMDRFPCGDVAYAEVPDDSYAQAVYPEVPVPDASYPLRTYHSLAHNGALADRYFQPIVGQSASNDLFLVRAGFVLQDNRLLPKERAYLDPNIGDLLRQHGVSWGVYLEGLDAGRAHPADNPFNYYCTTRHQEVDYSRLAADLAAGTLPAVSLIRPRPDRNEHPGAAKITGGELFVKEVLDALNGSPFAADTLVLVTWDEGGGYFDHVPPPTSFPDGSPLPTTAVGAAGADVSTAWDGEEQVTLPSSRRDAEYLALAHDTQGREFYGTRVPLLAVGRFARKGHVSHVVLEHSSIVKFIEWNWLADARLGTRDVKVNNLGDLLDPAETGTVVPSGP